MLVDLVPLPHYNTASVWILRMQLEVYMFLPSHVYTRTERAGFEKQ